MYCKQHRRLPCDTVIIRTCGFPSRRYWRFHRSRSSAGCLTQHLHFRSKNGKERKNIKRDFKVVESMERWESWLVNMPVWCDTFSGLWWHASKTCIYHVLYILLFLYKMLQVLFLPYSIPGTREVHDGIIDTVKCGHKNLCGLFFGRWKHEGSSNVISMLFENLADIDLRSLTNTSEILLHILPSVTIFTWMFCQ